MKNKVVGFIPRILYRIFLNLKEKFDPSPQISDEEIYAAAICEKLISKSNSEKPCMLVNLCYYLLRNEDD